jgi:hypothetical protein
MLDKLAKYPYICYKDINLLAKEGNYKARYSFAKQQAN